MKAKGFLVSLLLLGFGPLFASPGGIAETLHDVKARGKLIVGVKTDYPPLGFLDEKGRTGYGSSCCFLRLGHSAEVVGEL